MPKKATRKRQPKKVAKSEQRFPSIEFSPDTLLDEFDGQVNKKIKQISQKFMAEARKCLQLIPNKSSLPKKLSTMSIYEFRRRGNSLKEVMESLTKDEAVPQVDMEEHSVLRENQCATSVDLVTPAPPTARRSCRTRVKMADQKQTDLVTPAAALNTRSCRTTRAGTVARKPRPLEELNVAIQSKITGSPVDEGAVLEAHTKDTVEDMSALVMERLASVLPRCHRAKLTRTIKEIKAEMLASGRDLTVTPGIIR